MKRRSLPTLVLLVALAATLLPPPLAPQVATFDVANYIEQLKQFAQMIIDYYLQYESLVQEIQQLFQLVQQVEMMIQNLEQLEEMGANNPGRLLAQLQVLFSDLEGIVYRADDVLLRFDDHYTPGIAIDLPTEEDDRLTETLETYRTLLAAAQRTAHQSTDAARALEDLSSQLEAAEGNLQALQAVGAMTTQVATEVTRSNEVQAMTLNALTVQAAHELAAREHAERTFLHWIERGRHFQGGPPRQAFDPVPVDFRSRR